jgi:hypothetical protein
MRKNGYLRRKHIDKGRLDEVKRSAAHPSEHWVIGDTQVELLIFARSQL